MTTPQSRRSYFRPRQPRPIAALTWCPPSVIGSAGPRTWLTSCGVGADGSCRTGRRPALREPETFHQEWQWAVDPSLPSYERTAASTCAMRSAPRRWSRLLPASVPLNCPAGPPRRRPETGTATAIGSTDSSNQQILVQHGTHSSKNPVVRGSAMRCAAALSKARSSLTTAMLRRGPVCCTSEHGVARVG